MKSFRILIPVLTVCLFSLSVFGQNSPEKVVADIYNNSFKSDNSYNMLHVLCTKAPGRLPSTKESEIARELVKKTMVKYGADSVWLIPVNSTGWKQVKNPVTHIILSNNKKISLKAVSLGQSVSTAGNGINAQVVLIERKSQVDSLGENGLKGKIAFFNLKMKERKDYGPMVWQRTQGASMVAKYGAAGVVIRSLTTKYDNNPHTGVNRYADNVNKIPAVALSWQSADTLENLLIKDPGLKIHLEVFTENPGLVKTYNVAGDLKGTDFPNEIILITAHLDAWFTAQGAHDDGGGVVQIVDVLRIFKELKIKPRHTIRIMPYIDEEQFNSGIKQYADFTADDNKTHIFQIEVDHGVGVPYRYDIQADSAVFTKQDTWLKILEPYRMNRVNFSNSYAEGWPLYPKNKIIMAHLNCKDEHYFDYHHSANDVFEAVDKKNLQNGGAALAAFIYLIDKLDVIDNSKRLSQKSN